MSEYGVNYPTNNDYSLIPLLAIWVANVINE